MKCLNTDGSINKIQLDSLKVYHQIIIQINTKIMSESYRRNKENIKLQIGHKDNSNLFQNTIQSLKEQITSLQKEKLLIKKEWATQVDLLKLEISQYKRKLAIVTDRYLMESFTRQKTADSQSSSPDYQQTIREQGILIQQQKDNKKRVEGELKKAIDQSAKLRKQISMLKYQKQKNMEIGLLQKIDIEERNKLLEEEVKSKKNIISNLKRELDKIYSEKEEMNKKERGIEQKHKELDSFSKEISEYNRLNQIKMKQQIHKFTKQNQFLKSYIKKLEKMTKKQCNCEIKDQKVEENLFEIKRQLALAKVRLGQSYLNETRQKSKKKHQQSVSSQQSDNQSKEVSIRQRK